MSARPTAVHAGLTEPSPWVTRFAALVRPGGEVLDYACGSGRHARWLARRGLRVEAVDRDAALLQVLSDEPGVRTRLADLEGSAWPYEGRSFDAIVVTNYLYRPRFASLLDCLGPGGVLIYETFMIGNERFGKPSNPEFLLRRGELLDRLGAAFAVVAFEQGELRGVRPAVIQRVCAVKGDAGELVLPV